MTIENPESINQEPGVSEQELIEGKTITSEQRLIEECPGYLHATLLVVNSWLQHAKYTNYFQEQSIVASQLIFGRNGWKDKPKTAPLQLELLPSGDSDRILADLSEFLLAAGLDTPKDVVLKGWKNNSFEGRMFFQFDQNENLVMDSDSIRFCFINRNATINPETGKYPYFKLDIINVKEIEWAK